MLRSRLAIAFGLVFLALASGTRARASEACLPDVIGAIRALQNVERTDRELRTNHQFQGRYYTQDILAVFGADNHFQGIQRIPGTDCLVISGANYWKRIGNLFIADGTRVLKRLALGDRDHWHAGGLGSLDKIVAVPLEEYKHAHRSEIRFLDFEFPLSPRELPIRIVRPDRSAGAVSLSRLPDDRILLTTYTGGSYDFYESRSVRIEDGFENAPVASWTDTQGVGAGGSTIAVLKQCDGSYFMVGFDNDGKLPPMRNGRDFIRVQEIRGLASGQPIAIVPKGRFEIDCGSHCNFSAAAGAQIGADGRLRVLSTPFYLNFLGTRLNVAEFEEP